MSLAKLSQAVKMDMFGKSLKCVPINVAPPKQTNMLAWSANGCQFYLFHTKL